MADPLPEQAEWITLGRVVGLFGVRGAVKVQSHTDPLEALLDYREWRLDLPGGAVPGKLREGRLHGRHQGA